MDGRDVTLILGTILIGKMRKKKIYPCDISCTITPLYPDIHSRGGIKFSRGKQIPISGGQADSETYGNVHRCFYTGMDRWIEINEAIIDCCHS